MPRSRSVRAATRRCRRRHRRRRRRRHASGRCDCDGDGDGDGSAAAIGAAFPAGFARAAAAPKRSRRHAPTLAATRGTGHWSPAARRFAKSARAGAAAATFCRCTRTRCAHVERPLPAPDAAAFTCWHKMQQLIRGTCAAVGSGPTPHTSQNCSSTHTPSPSRSQSSSSMNAVSCVQVRVFRHL